jgi:hypothetical protein
LDDPGFRVSDSDTLREENVQFTPESRSHRSMASDHGAEKSGFFFENPAGL